MGTAASTTTSKQRAATTHRSTQYTSAESKEVCVSNRLRDLHAVENFMAMSLQAAYGLHPTTVSQFLSTPSAQACFKAFVKREIKNNTEVHQFFEDISMDLEDSRMFTTLAMKFFPQFLSSPEFARFREMENQETALLGADIMTALAYRDPPEASESKIFEVSSNTTSTSSRSASSSGKRKENKDQKEETALTNQRGHNTFIGMAVSVMEKMEVEQLFVGRSWLTHLLAVAESLPIPFSLATANPKRRGFPLIYVNRCFEAITGYSRQEIVGQNCRFLQAECTEPECIQALSTALRTATRVCVGITNKRKDGSTFFNHLVMKPVFDQDGRYRYVIGLQYCSSKAASASRDATAHMHLNDRLIDMLPDSIFVPSDDDE